MLILRSCLTWIDLGILVCWYHSRVQQVVCAWNTVLILICRFKLACNSYTAVRLLWDLISPSKFFIFLIRILSQSIYFLKTFLSSKWENLQKQKIQEMLCIYLFNKLLILTVYSKYSLKKNEMIYECFV